MARKSISKKARFEVFKRDSFTCQYCGKAAPDVVLHVDHIVPVAEGGKNDILNLISACIDCNLGKGARTLDDHSMASKQMKAAKEISERREQLRLLAEWRAGLDGLDDQQVSIVESVFKKGTDLSLTDRGRVIIKDAVKKFGLDMVLFATDRSIRQYVIDRSDKAQCQKAFDYIGRICYWEAKKAQNPAVAVYNHICNIASKQWWTCRRSNVWALVQGAHEKHGVDPDAMLEAVRHTTGIMQFEKVIQELIEGCT